MTSLLLHGSVAYPIVTDHIIRRCLTPKRNIPSTGMIANTVARLCAVSLTGLVKPLPKALFPFRYGSFNFRSRQAASIIEAAGPESRRLPVVVKTFRPTTHEALLTLHRLWQCFHRTRYIPLLRLPFARLSKGLFCHLLV